MKNIYKLDVAIISTTALILIFVVGYSTPLVISPINNLQTTESEILFSIQNADRIFIDDNIEFTTSEEYVLDEGVKINLAPGKYYWKAKGVFGSEIRTLTINSEINLELREINKTNFYVYNAGNVRLNVEIYNDTSLVERKKIEVSETIGLTGNKIIGRQDE